MADYGCYPLWYSPVYAVRLTPDNRIVAEPTNDPTPEYGCFDPGTLPLSPGTLAALDAWQDRFDRSLNVEDPASTYVSEKDKATFESEGIALWKALITELSDYQVVYYSTLGGVLVDPSHPDIIYKHTSDEEMTSMMAKFNKEVTT